MKQYGILLIISIYLIWQPVIGARGDKLEVTSELVNVRLGPGMVYPVQFKLQGGRTVIELQKHGEWIEISTDSSRDRTGWIHSSLLKTAGKQTIIIKSDGDSDPLFELFKLAYEEFSEDIKNKTGKLYFSDITNPENRIIQLMATADWLNEPRAVRLESINEVFTIWDAAVGDGLPITVDIVDASGDRLLSQFRQ